MKFDLTRINTVDYVTNTHTISEKFTDISILTTGSDISFKLATDGVCKIVCNEGERLFHTVKVEDNCLVIKEDDNRRWYENINISWGKFSITVYLPEYSYNSLILTTLGGEVEITKDFVFDNAEIITTSGNIDFTARINKKLKLNSSSGEITLGNIITEDVEIDTLSGDITLESVKCNNVNLSSTSGEINLNQVKISGDMQIKTTSGDIELEYSDAKALYLQSNSGDINGILLTPKIFSANTNSGDVSVPASDNGGKCSIITTSGDINMQIKTVCWVN